MMVRVSFRRSRKRRDRSDINRRISSGENITARDSDAPSAGASQGSRTEIIFNSNKQEKDNHTIAASGQTAPLSGNGNRRDFTQVRTCSLQSSHPGCDRMPSLSTMGLGCMMSAAMLHSGAAGHWLFGRYFSANLGAREARCE